MERIGRATIERVFRGHDFIAARFGRINANYIYVSDKVKEKLVGTTYYHYLVSPMIGST